MANFSLGAPKVDSFLKKLLVVHVCVYVFWVLLHVCIVLFWNRKGEFWFEKIQSFFMLRPSEVLESKKFWVLFTYAFVYGEISFLSVLYCWVCLYFFGSIAIELIGRKRFAITYLFGIFLLGVLFVICSFFVPALQESIGDVVSVSTPLGALSLLVMTLCVYDPNRFIYFNFVPARLKYVGLFWFLTSLIDIVAYYGGVMLYYGCMNLLGVLVGTLIGFILKRLDTPKHNRKKRFFNRGSLTDIDEIWEKMSRSGYGSLTPAEKERLFKQKDKPDS